MSEQEMLKSIYEHMMIMNREMGAIQAQVEFLCKFFWIVMTASIAGVIGTTINLIMHIKDNKRTK